MGANPFVNPQDAVADKAPARGQDRHILNPPAAQYVRVDDKLIIDYIAFVGANFVTINYRLMDTSGQIIEFQNAVPVVGDSALHTITINLNEGYLLGVTLQAGVGSFFVRGMAFFTVSIGRLIAPGIFLRGMCIISDYLTTIALLAWPGGTIKQSADGPGWLRAIIVNPPAPGADWQLAIGVNARVKLKSVFATLTTSAAVANRIPILGAQNGGLNFFRSGNNTTAPASAVRNWVWASCYNAAQGALPDIGLPLPSDLPIPQLSTLQTLTTNIQVADQWSNIMVECEQWVDA